jgi:hypothetical protein
MIAFVYQGLNSQLHHRATNHKKLSVQWQSVIWRNVETSPALNVFQTMGSTLNVSQTMGNIQHIMGVLSSSTFKKPLGNYERIITFGEVGRILGGGWHLGTVFRLRFEQRTNQTNTNEKRHEPICATKSVCGSKKRRVGNTDQCSSLCLRRYFWGTVQTCGTLCLRNSVSHINPSKQNYLCVRHLLKNSDHCASYHKVYVSLDSQNINWLPSRIVGLCNADALCFLWGRNWTFKCCLFRRVRTGNRLGVFENSSLMIIFGAKREEVVGTGGTCRMGSFVIYTNQALWYSMITSVRIRWVVRVECVGGTKHIKILVIARGSLGMRRRRRNFQMDFYLKGWGVDWIHLAQRRDQRRAVVNTVMKLSLSIEVMCILCWLCNCWLYK